jgi:hypothetical protein
VVLVEDCTGFGQNFMTISDFKTRVAGFINRDVSTFTVSSFDHILAAMNDARRGAQRLHSFDLCRGDVFLATSVAGAAWTTGCKTTPGGATVALMKRVDSVWTYSTTTVGATTAYLRNYRIPLESVGSFKRELGVYAGTSSISTRQNDTISRPFAYVNGEKLHVTTITASTDFLINGIVWLDDLTSASSPDIFLTYFTDWLFWATIMQMNTFLKDTEKITVDSAMVTRLWESVKYHDGTIANQGDVSLD